MANTWITDMTHFLDAEGNVPDQLRSRRLIHHLGSIVAAVTSESAETSRELEIKCRRKPDRKPCPGTIQTGSEPCPLHSEHIECDRWIETKFQFIKASFVF